MGELRGLVVFITSMERRGVRNVKKTGIPKKGRGKGRPRGKQSRDITYGDMYRKINRDVMPIVNLAKRMFNTENKYLDTVGSMSISTTASLVLLNGMAQGTTASTRLGDTVKFNFINCNITVTINAAATASVLRMFLVRDIQPNGSAFAYTSYAATNNNPVTLTNFSQETRFYTYLDELICVDSAGPQVLSFRVSKPLGFHCNYGLGNAGTAADISENTLYFVMISNEATNTVTVSYAWRLLFVDN